MITAAQLHQMIEELDRGSFVILDDNDREFVEGVKMLIEMQEPVPPDAVQRVATIYKKFQEDMHNSLGGV